MPKKAADKVVVISCEEDKSVCQTAVAKGIDIVSAEFVLTGVLRQEVDINGYPFVQNNYALTFKRKKGFFYSLSVITIPLCIGACGGTESRILEN